MTLSIHQPNYLPWLGFFDKIKQSDIFVIFDNVQYPRGKNHFGNRNKIKIPNKDKWLTVPVAGKSEIKNFNEIGFKNNTWKEEHLRLLKVFYEKAPYFNDYYEDFSFELRKEYSNLSDLSTNLIKYFLKVLDINTEIILSSDVVGDNITGEDRVMKILFELNAKKYITGSGPGSKRYIDENKFKENNIELVWQEYKHPIYNQLHGDFIPYMNILDLLFNEGTKSRGVI